MSQVAENKMGTRPVGPLLIGMALPMIASMLMQALYNVVDSIFVSRVSEAALTAVGLAFPIQNLMIAVGVGTGVGVNALLSKSLGEKNFEQADRAAENGIFLALASTVVFMVLGGLFSGYYFQVQKVEGPEKLLELCASCEQQSTHPIAASIVAAANSRNLELRTPESLEELPGMGIRAVLDGEEILCGNARLLEEAGVVFPRNEAPGTVVLVAAEKQYLGYLVIDDTLKPGAEPAVRKLRNQGLETVMLTGDSEVSAKAVAGAAGIRQVFAGLLPQQKLERLQKIREQRGAVLFVGDGINDAPVLAGADVGAAMGSGADAAIEAADVVFMTSDVEAIPQALEIAKNTGTIAWQNVIFALAVKLVVMYLGLRGFASMWLAVFADSGVAMLCVLNSIRMLYKK